MSAGRTERQIFRLHLGGLSPTISMDDIESRFRRFGEVQDVNILLDKFPVEGRQPQCRGFAYVSLYATPNAVEQCRTTFNGCNWKGRKLRVNYAKPDFESLRKQELNRDCLKMVTSTVCPHSVCECKMGHTAEIVAVRISNDGQWVATASVDSTCKIWQCPALCLHKTLRGHMKSLCDCVWAHGVAFLATASDDQTVQIWDAESGRSLLCLRGHKGPVTSCDFNSTDTLIASASYDESIRLWDTKSGVCVARLPAHSDPVTSVHFSRDSTVLVSCGYDGVCRLWDVHTTSCLQSMNFDVPLARVYALESPSSVLVTTQQEDVFMWNIETGFSSNLHVKSGSRALRLLLTTDDDEILFVDSRGAFWLWNISNYHLTCVAEPSTFRTLLESSTVVFLSHRKNILVTSCFSHDRINVWTV